MKVFAYCAESFVESTERGAGVAPLTCPPVRAENFQPAWLEDWDLLYFDLHGWTGARFWQGDRGIVALTADHVLQADLGGAVVFAGCCHLAERESPMLDALLDAGTSYVIAGEGANWLGTATQLGAGLLGMWFRRLLGLGLPPMAALNWAKRRVWLSGLTQKMWLTGDALAFRAFTRRR